MLAELFHLCTSTSNSGNTHIVIVLCASSVASEDIESTENSGDHKGNPVLQESVFNLLKTKDDFFIPCKSTKGTGSLKRVIPFVANTRTVAEVSAQVRINDGEIAGIHAESNEASKPEQGCHSIQTQHNEFMTQFVAEAWDDQLVANNDKRPYSNKNHKIGLIQGEINVLLSVKNVVV